MKRILLFIGLVVAFLSTQAQDNTAYTEAMQAQLVLLDSAHSSDDLQAVINTMERIAQVETAQWHPRYYLAYASLHQNFYFKESAERAKYLDKAQAYLDKALVDFPQHSELLALQGFVWMIRVSLDPATYGQLYAGKTMEILQKAKALNPNNPRAAFLLGQMSYGTAQFFGQSTEQACALVSQAVSLYETATPTDSLAPKWGKKGALSMQEKCGL
ncbi:hypothetical protein QWY31_08350 [Cytophagales bacterium LB-30]|uniref:Tetratricopeptide repeat protein n=1 Tax=Shiella aurantiaca TaxID=3058365 RepID=A0ABT8F4X0_9BACT|nr:hypothetical protein [Shiella aurantiaca]MDN4165508.1 hypothetical protein [Shiella aurantiaca]